MGFPVAQKLCLFQIKVKCQCGNLSRVVICCENEREYQRIRTSQLAAQMFRDENNYTTCNDFSGSIKGSGNSLECNEECSQLERNRRVALALQIENPDVSNKVTGPPKYSDFLKDLARREPFFARAVHEALADLVMKTKEVLLVKSQHCG